MKRKVKLRSDNILGGLKREEDKKQNKKRKRNKVGKKPAKKKKTYLFGVFEKYFSKDLSLLK